MTKMKKFLLSLFMLAWITPLSMFAFTSIANDTVSINETINMDVYVAGWDIQINAPLTKDLVTAGGNILIQGAIGEDLIAAWWTVIVSWSIGESARIAWWQITINSQIASDLLVAWWQITLWKDTIINGDASIAWWDITIEWVVKGTWTIIWGKVILGWVFEKNVKIQYDEKITILPSAVIKWNLEYTSRKINTDLEKIVQWKITYNKHQFNKTAKMAGIAWIVWMMASYVAYKFIFLVLIGILLIFTLGKYLSSTAEYIKTKPRKTLLYWFLLFACMPFAIMILMFTFIGIPLGIMWILIYIMMFLLYKLLGTAVRSMFFIKKLWSPDKVIRWKKVLIIMACALFFTIISGFDIILSFFAFGALLMKKSEMIKTMK